MKTVRNLTINGSSYEIEDPNAASINDELTAEDQTWSSEKIAEEIDAKVPGKLTEEGGVIFGDYVNNYAKAQYAAAFGTHAGAYGIAAFAQGYPIWKRDVEYVKYPPTADGQYIVVSEDCEYAQQNPGGYVVMHEGILGILREKYDIDAVQVSDGRYCDLNDQRKTEAYGTGAMAAGMGAIAFSRASHSLGYRTQTGYPPSAEYVALRPELITKLDADGNIVYPEEYEGQSAFAIGADTAALANHSFAGGHLSVAYATNSFAFGQTVTAKGLDSFAACRNTITEGVASTALGCKCYTGPDAFASFAGGYESEVTGMHAFAFGHGVKAKGEDSTVIGWLCEAIGGCSFAMGKGSKADNFAAFAGGNGSKSIGQYAFAYGNGVNANGDSSACFGQGTYATAQGQMVAGMYNVQNSDALFIVGNGTGHGNKSNAFEVMKDGGMALYSPAGKRFKITVSNDGTLTTTAA